MSTKPGKWRRTVMAALALEVLGAALIPLFPPRRLLILSHNDGTELTTAVNLARNIREIANQLPLTHPQYPASTTYKDPGGPPHYKFVWDLNGDTYSPPLDIHRRPIPQYADWAQRVNVQSLELNDLTSNASNSTSGAMFRLTVVMLHRNVVVHQMTWLIARPTETASR